MLTPQEVSSHAFPKAVMGGYNMAAVDEFLDELTDDYTALYKENTALKAKMKVLVEKVEDYRSTEDSMRATLLTAQKMADSIVREAEVKRDQLMSRAEVDARARIGELQNEAVEAAERLRAGQRELAAFVASVRSVCQRELDYLENLPQLAVDSAPPAAAAEEVRQERTAGEIEERIFAAFTPVEESTEPEEIAEAEEMPQSEEAPQEERAEEVGEETAGYPEGNPFEEEQPMERTRRIDLKDLKFGRNYSGKDD